jgi:DNA processing protein
MDYIEIIFGILYMAIKAIWNLLGKLLKMELFHAYMLIMMNILVDMALEQGKDVYALPGPINSALSQGCNRLIKQGAELILSPEDLLEELGMRVAEMSDNKTRKKIVLETAEDMVYSCLDFRPQNLNDIMERAKMPVSQLLDILVSLELRGLIKEISKNYYAVVEEL